MKYLGFLLLVIGFFLIPIGIGVFIFVAGIALLIFDFYHTWVNRLVPKVVREKMSRELTDAYEPYQPSINSIKSVGREIFTTSAIIFAVIIILTVIVLRFGITKEAYWKCDANNVWVKNGDPSYPSPIISCAHTISLAKNETDCLAQNGVWAKQGPEPFKTCNRKAIDRGNLCRDNNECEGMCQTNVTDKDTFGQCSVWIVELGCKSIMKKGKAKVVCMD